MDRRDSRHAGARAAGTAAPRSRRLGDVFDEALERVAPFFDRRATGWGADLEYCAYRLMREQYPDLTLEEVYVFVVAAGRLFAARRAYSPRPGDKR